LRTCHGSLLYVGVSGQRAGGGVVQHDGDHSRLQGCRALDG
jgi:hypothetical protein